jgi:hypothetical protein
LVLPPVETGGYALVTPMVSGVFGRIAVAPPVETGGYLQGTPMVVKKIYRRSLLMF